MITNSSIKIAIMQTYKSLNSTFSKEELIATEILFYKFILSYIKSNPEQINDISTLIQSYSGEYQNRFILLKNNATAYKDIINYLKDIDANNLLNIQEYHIDIIYQIFINSKNTVNFNSLYFDPLMYNVNGSNNYNYLEKIHFKIMVPIFNYYKNKYKIKDNDFKISSADNVNGNEGKIILFYIENISSATVYSDLLANKIPIYGYECKLEYPYIKLIIL